MGSPLRRKEVRRVGFVDKHTIPGACMLLESKRTSGEDSVDLAAYDDSLLKEGGDYICGLTGRVNGPDYRPADPEKCRKGRPCFKEHMMF
ncbi:MAG: hypothetical protein D6691_11195 [Candidatus Hydrogenedentota bacterium]|jgi:hypothetical protein|nr:MAG: hypothetical protein D6691_11195 [Candidatus Hydrogenedentota bacterium]